MDPQPKGIDYSQWESNIQEHHRLMLAVRDTAVQLLHRHPRQASVYLNRTDSLSAVSIVTDFSVTLQKVTKKFSLTYSITSWRTGNFENSVRIRQPGKSHLEGLGYRLEIVQGHHTDARYRHQTEVASDPTLDPQFASLLNTLNNESFITTPDGDLASISDHYAETSIKTSGALTILQRAKKFARPKSWTPSVSFQEFLQHIRSTQSGRSPYPQIR